jgi:hypothetical protein
MNPNIDSWKRRLFHFCAVFPIFGRNSYERMNSRLERQIKIREEKRKNIIIKHKNRQLYPFYEGPKIQASRFFDQ